MIIIFAGGNGSGIYLSTNNGSNWIQTSVNNATPRAMIIYNGMVIEGGGGTSSIYISTDFGTTWIPRMEGMPYWVNALCIANNYIFAGTDGYGVFRRPLNELVGVNKISEEMPSNYELKQNYPNPFNPMTKIRFAVPKNSFIQIKIYDVLGRIKEIPVNEKLIASEYEFTVDASNYSSGVYFYQLIADGNIIGTKKFVIAK